MKTLTYQNETLQAEKIVKTDTDIIGYINNKEVFVFRGISDFTQFQIDSEWDIDPDIKKEQRIADLETAIAVLLGGGA